MPVLEATVTETTISPEDRARQAASLAARESPGNPRAPIRAAASALFYECGEMPSANKLLKILGKGSLTTITDEIRSFWSEVRDGARQELEIKGVPDRVAGALRKLAPAIWDEALAEARSEMAAAVASAQAEATSRVESALQERDLALNAAEVARESQDAAAVKLASALVANAGLTDTLEALRGQIAELQRQRSRADEDRAALASQLAHVQASAEKFEESAGSERRRLMQEVDALRQSNRATEASVESQVSQRMGRISESHARELASLGERLDVELKKNNRLQGLLDAQVQATSELGKQYQSLMESMSGGMKQIEDRVAGLAIQVAAPPAPKAAVRKRKQRAAKGSVAGT